MSKYAIQQRTIFDKKNENEQKTWKLTVCILHWQATAKSFNLKKGHFQPSKQYEMWSDLQLNKFNYAET